MSSCTLFEEKDNYSDQAHSTCYLRFLVMLHQISMETSTRLCIYFKVTNLTHVLFSKVTNFVHLMVKSQFAIQICSTHYIGGSKVGGARDALPHPGPISFIFMQFSGKFWPNDRLTPPPPVWEILDSPLHYFRDCVSFTYKQSISS